MDSSIRLVIQGEPGLNASRSSTSAAAANIVSGPMNEPGVVELGTQLLPVLSLSGLFAAAALTYTGGLQGTGDTRSPHVRIADSGAARYLHV